MKAKPRSARSISVLRSVRLMNPGAALPIVGFGLFGVDRQVFSMIINHFSIDNCAYDVGRLRCVNDQRRGVVNRHEMRPVKVEDRQVRFISDLEPSRIVPPLRRRAGGSRHRQDFFRAEDRRIVRRSTVNQRSQMYFKFRVFPYLIPGSI